MTSAQLKGQTPVRGATTRPLQKGGNNPALRDVISSLMTSSPVSRRHFKYHDVLSITLCHVSPPETGVGWGWVWGGGMGRNRRSIEKMETRGALENPVTTPATAAARNRSPVLNHEDNILSSQIRTAISTISTIRIRNNSTQWPPGHLSGFGALQRAGHLTP